MDIKPYLNQNFHEIKRLHLQSGQLFCDSLFPAVQSSISVLNRNKKGNKLSWKRPHDIVSDPKFITDGINPNDFHQGENGNW